MIDKEKVIKGLENCMSRYIDGLCNDCPYLGKTDDTYMVPMRCKELLIRDAFALLREQEDKIKSLEQTIEDICCG